MNKNKALALMIFICALPAQALQIHTVVDDAQIKAKISAKETSRITLVGDRVKQFFINQGRILVERDEIKGDLYVTPTAFFQNKDINLFVTSEQGKTFSLLLVPTEMPSATISLKPTGANNNLAKAWEKESSYENTLVQLIKSMATGVVPKGYQVKSSPRNQFKFNDEALKVQAITQYTGSKFTGYVLYVRNTKKEKLKLKLSDLAHINPLATAIEEQKLYPKMKTRIFVVTSNE